MKKDQNTTTGSGAQGYDDQLQALLADAKKISRKIDDANNEANKEMSRIEAEVDKSIGTIEKIYADLDQIEKETGDELDTLILEQAEELAAE